MHASLPTHLAIIPDGNRRWAQQHGLLPLDGHAKGAAQFRTISTAAFKSGISSVTFWAGSEDNLLKRSKIEIAWLVKIFIHYLKDESLLQELRENQTRFRVLGRWKEILKNAKLARAISHLETVTNPYTRHNLTILFGYDGRREITHAIQSFLRHRSPAVEFDDVKKRLWTQDLPAVDLVIRTGEQDPGWAHWSSGFMMWDTANAEIYFTSKFWPDFSEGDLADTLAHYQKRRKKGGA
jgi:undecaprenyl diphosphate synthase